MSRVAILPVGLNRMTFWRYCMLCAGYAQWLADLCDVDDQQAWLGGMMLRLGEINLGQAQAFALPQIESEPIQPGERWQRERHLIGFDEGEVTAELAQHWDLPEALVQGLRHSARPLAAPDFSRLAAVLHLAAHLADSGAITAQSIDGLPLLLLQMLQLDPQTLSLDPPDAQALADISMFQN
jgi:HD-like signal output (HDOD) protein